MFLFIFKVINNIILLFETKIKHLVLIILIILHNNIIYIMFLILINKEIN